MNSQILLVSQIAACRTKVKSWEIHMTKVDILSFVIPSFRSLAIAIGLIWILQYHNSVRRFLCQCIILPSLAFITVYIHLARLLITFLYTSFTILPHSTCISPHSLCISQEGQYIMCTVIGPLPQVLI